MRRILRNILFPVGFSVLATGLLALLSWPALADQTQIKPKILINFDTSGSMLYDIGGSQTSGDGTWDHWTGGRFCCPGDGESRIYIAKELEK